MVNKHPSCRQVVLTSISGAIDLYGTSDGPTKRVLCKIESDGFAAGKEKLMWMWVGTARSSCNSASRKCTGGS